MSQGQNNQEKHLIDYLVIVGVKRPDGNALQTPSLLNRYPKVDRSSFPLPQDIVYFCQPEGCLNVCRRSSQSLHEDTTSFVFTLTEKDSGHTRYGVCVNFYRPFERRDLDKLRKRSCKKKTQPRADSLTHDGLSDDDESKIAESACDVASSKELSDAALSDDNSPVPAKASPRRQRKIRTHTLTSLCIVSRQPFISGFRRCLLTLKRIIEACYLRTKRRNSRKRYNSIWSILSGSANVSVSSLSGAISKEVEEIEDWVGRLLHAPVPSPGKSKLVLELLPPHMQVPLTFALPTESRLSLLDFPFHLPLELLGVDLTLEVVEAILLEHKVVLRSRDYNALSMSVLALTSALYPLQYMFPVIPLLPVCLPGSEQLLLAPTPYIIGVPAPFFDAGFVLPPDVWLVDLDSNRVLRPETSKPLPKLPEPDATTLRSELKLALESMSLHSTADSFGNDVDSVDVAARVALVRFLMSGSVLHNLSDHTRTLRLYPRPVVAFQAAAFVHSRTTQSDFVRELAATQSVEYFGEWSLAPDSHAFLRISNDVLDPALVGDKAKWFSGQLREIRHSAIDESALFVSTLHAVDDSDSDPTDESAASSSRSDDDSGDEPVRTASSDSSTSSASSNSDETKEEVLRAAGNVKRSPFPSVKGPGRRTLIDHRSVVRHGPAPAPPSSPKAGGGAQFVQEIVGGVVQGKGVGWFNLKKTARLMESEELRMLLVQQLNRTTDANEDFFEHVEINPRVYRGMSDLLKCAVAGVEHSYRQTHGLGGLASALQLLEVAHTHYYCRAKPPTSETTELRFRSGAFVEVESAIQNDEERVYLAQALLGGPTSILSRLEDQALGAAFQLSKERSDLWDDMAFWEQMFLDAVALERDAVGMDQGPTDLMERYRSLAARERRRLEEEEDKLLSTILYNMLACMITVKVSEPQIKSKIRRLLGKSHVGLVHSGRINALLEQLTELSRRSEAVDLKPSRSRYVKKQSFVVHYGASPQDTLLFMEVCDDSVVVRTGGGAVIERWWYDKFLNSTFCPKTKVVCIWLRKGRDATVLKQFRTTKCRELYACVREATKKAEARRDALRGAPDPLGGEFPVQDAKSGECGLLQVTLDGVNLKFSGNEIYYPVNVIKKCDANDGTFYLDEYKQDTDQVVTHEYKSPMAGDIRYAVICLFSYKVAGRALNQR